MNKLILNHLQFNFAQNSNLAIRIIEKMFELTP